MKNLMRMCSTERLAIAVICCVAISFLLVPAKSFAESTQLPTASQGTLRLGERIYREGILPSGKPLRASISAPGTTFACVSCHLLSGLGYWDEGVYKPPINGEKLFRPLPRFYKGIEQSKKSPLTPLRSAYTDESLIEALRSGRNPDGRVLNEAMPRYPLEDSDARVLVTYLKSLSAQFSPGISDTSIHFATVISEDIRPEIRKAMLASLDNYSNIKNIQAQAVRNTGGTAAKTRLMAENMLGSKDLVTKSIYISHWTLSGPPETWRSQLEEYNRKDPVFALLGGVVNGLWKPIHQFCEENEIPCLFPNTDFPVVSDTDLYTLYLSKGYYQEGESAARYLNSKADLLKGRPVVQVARASSEAEALSAGFQQTWQGLGQQAPLTVSLPSGKELDGDFLQQLIDKERPGALIVWDNSTSLPALERLRSRDGQPEMVILSARYLGESVWTLKESIRDITYLTYPFAFSPYIDKPAMGKKVLDDRQQTLRKEAIPLKDEVQKMVNLTNSLTQMLTFMLMDLKGNYYRDNLLDVAGMMQDQQYPLYGRISFETGQRYASRGCFIVQLSHGDNPELVKKSSWVIQ